jgi:hypothetical protein
VSYTNDEQVRQHLVFPFPVADPMREQQVVMTSEEYVSFYGGAVDEPSLVVKSLQTNEPTRTAVTLASGQTTLGASLLVPGSVVVASDSSLGTVYVEAADYTIDYSNGSVAIKSGGQLSQGQVVTVWYLAYQKYQVGIDYDLRGSRGELRALGGGDIAEGEIVWLDYSPLYVSFTDEIITNAVVAANGLIEREVDPERQFGADATLTTAATFRAVEIVCRIAATRELSRSTGHDKVALAWLKLAEDNAVQSEKLMRFFHPPESGPSAPRHT